MGLLKDSIAQADYLTAAQQLGDMRQRMRQIGGQIISLAAAYKGVVAMAADADDEAELASRKDAAIASVKADFAATDAATKAIIDAVLTDLLAE